jgi:hypothetical protein
MRSGQKTPVRFPLTMEFRYRAKTEPAIVSGTSATKWISSRQIAFVASDEIQEKAKIQIAIAWPYLLDDHVRLQLIIEAVVTKVADGIAEAAILQHDFRTRKEREQADLPDRATIPPNPIPPAPRVLAAGTSAPW